MAAQKEAWNTSNEKTKELTMAMFGPVEEVRAIAMPTQTAHNRFEAKLILQAIMKKGPFISRTGVVARLTVRTIGKIVSSDALTSSFNQAVHYHAVANLEKLFANAIEPWEFDLNPNKENKDLKARRYLYAPLEYEEKLVIVKFTVKEYRDPALTSKLYSIEAINTELL